MWGLKPTLCEAKEPQEGRSINDGSVLTAVGEQATITESDFDTFHEAIHSRHDSTHGGIGGDMGNVFTAALDPIFYLHHCNIDRCWRHWQLSFLGNSDPSPTPAWWGTSWQFFDETGALVTMTGQEAEHTPSLGYVYDDEPRRLVIARPKKQAPPKPAIGTAEGLHMAMVLLDPQPSIKLQTVRACLVCSPRSPSSRGSSWPARQRPRH